MTNKDYIQTKYQEATVRYLVAIIMILAAVPAMANPDGSVGTIWLDLAGTASIGGDVVMETPYLLENLTAEPSSHSWSAAIGFVAGDNVSMEVGFARKWAKDDWSDYVHTRASETILTGRVRVFLAQP